MARLRTFLLMFGGIFFLMSALQLVRYLMQPADIWWTPKAMAVPLGQASDRVVVYVDEVSLPDHIKAGRLQLVSDTGARPVREPDVRLRFNNWDRVRAEGIPSLLTAGITLGISGVVLLIGLLGWGPIRLHQGPPHQGVA